MKCQDLTKQSSSPSSAGRTKLRSRTSAAPLSSETSHWGLPTYRWKYENHPRVGAFTPELNVCFKRSPSPWKRGFVYTGMEANPSAGARELWYRWLTVLLHSSHAQET